MRLLKDIVDNTPLPIAVYSGDDLKIELANTAMIKTWGKGDQVLGKNYLEVLPEIKKEDFFQQATTALKTGVPFHAIDKKVDLVINGVMRTHYFNYSFIPLTDEEGHIYAVMNPGSDVTDIHVAKLKLQSAEQRLRIAIESSGMGTYEIDLATKKVTACGNFNAILGIQGEISNEELLAKLHPEDLTTRAEAHQVASLTGKISYQSRILNPDGSARWIKINGRVIRDQNGDDTAIIGIIQDIHEQKAFEEELKKQVAQNTQELQRSNDDLLHFAGCGEP